MLNPVPTLHTNVIIWTLFNCIKYNKIYNHFYFYLRFLGSWILVALSHTGATFLLTVPSALK